MQNTSYFRLAVVIFKVLLLAMGLVVILAIRGFVPYHNQSVDLIQDKNWQYFPGATTTSNGIHFTPLNRIIIHQDGSLGQTNPPVNISGQHLNVKGDFKITAIISSIDKWASLRFYGAPPLVYDQWRYETPSIDITVDAKNNVVVARIWDGASDTSMDIRTYEVSLPETGNPAEWGLGASGPKIIISLEHINSQINIIENGHTLGSMPDHNIFDSGTVWFGTDGAPESLGWTLTTLEAKAMGNGSVTAMPPPLMVLDKDEPESLRNLADTKVHKIKIGTALNADLLFIDQEYRNLALGQFNMVTPENSLKPQFIHPAPDLYDFAQADLLVDAALKNNIMVHGHALVYDKSNPEWMVKSKKEDRQQIMVSHVENVVSHFKGRVAEWDVINEPFSKKNVLYKDGKSGLEPNIWFEAMDENYLDLAFQTAHAADPGAKLYLNDYGTEREGQHWDALLNLVKRLKQRGVPIDGVGFETHIYGDGDYINADQLKKHMEILKGLGLLVRVSEIDVTQDDAKEQINQYVTALDICLRAPNCTSYSMWGITDRYGSTTRSDRYPLVYGTSLLWDKDMKAKPAYSALQNRLLQDY